MAGSTLEGLNPTAEGLSTMVERLHATVGSVLDSLDKKCDNMGESKQLCRGVYTRLEFLGSHEDQLREHSRLEAFTSLLLSYMTLLRKQKKRALLERFAGLHSIQYTLQGMHGRVDEIFKAEGFEESEQMDAWRETWAGDVAEQERILSDLVGSSGDSVLANEFNGEGPLTLALTKLKGQEELRTQSSPELKKLMHDTVDRVAKFKKMNGPRVFSWFIALEELVYDENPIAVYPLGTVHIGTWKKPQIPEPKPAVIKFVRLEENTDKTKFVEQLQLWKKLEHPNILTLHGGCHVGHTSAPLFYVCEKAECSFVEFFNDEENKSCIWRMFLQVAQALAYLHCNHIVHGGLKCTNILVDTDASGNKVAKLGDFGFAFIRTLSAQLSDKATTEDIRWKAPECLLQGESESDAIPLFESDLYSLGMCMIEAWTSMPPFGMGMGGADDNEVEMLILDAVLAGQGYPRPENIPDRAWELIERLLVVEPCDRPSLFAVIEELQGLANAEDEPEAEVGLEAPVM